jgi:restriction system protein
MALWLCRAGSRGEHEERFLDEGRVYLTWGRLDDDLTQLQSRSDIQALLARHFPDASERKHIQHSGQIWAFVRRMQPGDWVLVPSKFAPTIHVAEIVSEFHCDVTRPDSFRYWRDVKWLARDVPRSDFDKDILLSLGAFLTICQIKRNNAETRVRAMQSHDWSMTGAPAPIGGGAPEPTGRPSAADSASVDYESSSAGDEIDEYSGLLNVEETAREAIAAHILAKFKGHDLERLVGAVLEAQGYTVYRSEQGPDGGIDLLAAPGQLGFGAPRICVQVKSQQSTAERVILDQLIGTMTHVNADRGLLVCWGGFKASVRREEARNFFNVRLWDRDDLIDALLDCYDRLESEIRAEIPLKQVWTLSLASDD